MVFKLSPLAPIAPPLTPAFPNYDTTSGHLHERHSPQPTYGYTTRTTSPPPMNPTDPRRLPPLTTSSSPGGDRWQQSANYNHGMPAVHGYPSGNSIRSPTASYPSQYVTYPSGNQGTYTYMSTYDPLAMTPQGQQGLFDDIDSVGLQQPRSTSPYGRTHAQTQLSSTNFTPPPVSPISPEEPTIKKKRKRADAAQLKVLNETYARTAFPSTEERQALAKRLDMSARSVQIWFQNKRQSMRQTNRQSSTVSSSGHQQQYALQSSHNERLLDDGTHGSSYGGSITLSETPYMTGSSVQDAMTRSHTSLSSSAHRRVRGPEEDAQRWPRGY
ncbi:hypothetical protein CC1G_01991 [Coprinopsis cinerea okayama7|uniref:Homeobox domain-containing protein n=1 Tax=Coprinopsis cinerea (strain Okayama-7 / 130 / ATCC MYA-4618 / FGSC 9003) TaxID=240176 RepID=A8N680_COPC7|nr:hypothetical protein CC1G_01991 [Coprinopsis cinerea okayama7\|eukprot:XP_001830355.2 hypothetical protein CC1G_01991 [Coprinopsis cinerea okayama7\